MRGIFLIWTIVLLLSSSVYGQYYMSSGLAHQLRVDSGKVLIKFESSQSSSNESITQLIQRIADEDTTLPLVDNFHAYTLNDSLEYFNFLDSLDTLPGVMYSEPYYYIGEKPLPTGSRFCVGFHDHVSQSTIDSINQVYHVVIESRLAPDVNEFILERSELTTLKTLDLSNLYYELDETFYSHPIFADYPIASSYQLYDYYHNNQWQIKKVIGEFNTAAVWDFAGLEETLKVAVLDAGIEPHEDLDSIRIINDWDYVDDDNLPYPFQNGHGMACAGIIGANHCVNSIYADSSSSGLISLNPNLEIISIRVLNQHSRGVSVDKNASAFHHARLSGADVISCSWNYEHVDDPTPWSPLYDNLTYAIKRCYDDGRNGLGTPIIFSAGNFGERRNFVSYPANLAETFGVGAIDQNDTRWSYSSFGDSLDLVAPSGDDGLTQGDFWCLDEMGLDGWNSYTFTYECPESMNDPDYYCRFGGTSAAAPIVSGIASLIIAKDPTLEAEDVYEIMRHSAVTDFPSFSITPPDIYYGYGRVDAFRAILSISRGDVDNSGIIDVSDMLFILDYFFTPGSPAPFPSILLGDVNCSGIVDISDVLFLNEYMFYSGPPPVNPCYKY